MSAIIVVELSDAELTAAKDEAERRIAEAAKGDFQPKYGSDHDEAKHRNGARAECAAAKEFGLPWPGASFGVDVVFFDVRSTPYRTGHLILHEKDADQRPFVLAITGPRVPRVVRLIGWLYAYEGKCACYIDSKREGGKSFFVPQDKLRPMWRLRRMVDELRQIA